MLCAENSGDGMNRAEHARGMVRDQTFDISAPLAELVERTGIPLTRVIKDTGLTASTVYNYARGPEQKGRKAGMDAIRRIAAVFGVPWAVFTDRPETVELTGRIDNRGVFAESNKQTHSGAGVGKYVVDGLEEAGVGPGDVVTFVPATTADVRPGRWLSVRIDGDLQLCRAVEGPGELVMLQRPGRKALLQYVPQEHEVVGRLGMSTRFFD